MKTKIKRVNDIHFTKIFSKYCNLEEGPWIAGGSARKLWQGKPWQRQDVDFFFRNPKQFCSMIERIHEFGRVESKYETQNAITYRIYVRPDKNTSIFDLGKLKSSDDESLNENYLNIQLIETRWHINAWTLISDFDLGLSQFVTDGNVVLASNEAIVDVTYNIIRENQYEPREITPARLTKYCAYGFEPNLPLLKKVLKTTIKSGYSNDQY